jgi:hypothetical protein
MGVNNWVVVVEENIQLWNDRRWEISKYFAAEDYERALALAHQTAMYYVPPHPKDPQSRTLLRTPDGSWLVHVRGAATEWHFRVTVAEHYGDHPGKPQS